MQNGEIEEKSLKNKKNGHIEELKKIGEMGKTHGKTNGNFETKSSKNL